MAVPGLDMLTGYHDTDGTWRAASDEAVRRIGTALGDAPAAPPMWFVPETSTEPFWNPCRIVLEDGTDIGIHEGLPGDLALGYHDLIPVDGGPTTRLVVHPRWCPPLPRVSGVAVQVYALWDELCWGIGDLGSLARIGRRVAAAGGTVMLLSPLHQPAPGYPQADSPYSPSTRRAANPLLIAIDRPPPADLVCSPGSLIDRDLVWMHKRAQLWSEFRLLDPPAQEPTAIGWWNARRERYGPDRSSWPADDVGDDSLRHAAQFHDWLQQRLDQQVAAVRATGVGLIGDLAVGFAPDGADADEYHDLLASDMRIGAPPDEFNPDGQEWGLPPFVPSRLRAARYEPFIATVRAALQGMVGLRIDHVMGLFRQYWVPVGASPLDGAYVRYPADELLAIVALEATRAGAFVIGEDLGTVDDDIRAALTRWGVAGTRVLWFEDDPPANWPSHCLATATTHDLPTIAGVAALADDDPRRRRLEAVAPTADRAADVARLVHSAILASPAQVRLLALDDLAGATDQANVPGTVGPPNWCRRLPLPVDEIPLGTGFTEPAPGRIEPGEPR